MALHIDNGRFVVSSQDKVLLHLEGRQIPGTVISAGGGEISLPASELYALGFYFMEDLLGAEESTGEESLFDAYYMIVQLLGADVPCRVLPCEVTVEIQAVHEENQFFNKTPKGEKVQATVVSIMAGRKESNDLYLCACFEGPNVTSGMHLRESK